ncbi:MAG: MTAP family purine nucleoside phosphorylase [Candidatus Anammoxibacter sp.]
MKSEFAIIGGSQAYDLLKTGDVSGERLGPVNTPFGLSQPIYRLGEEFGNAFFLSRHGEKAYSITAPFVNYRANIYALKDKGVKRIVSWSGPGTINTNFKIGQYVIVDDIIDETKRRKSTFFENKGIGFVRQNPVFCTTLRGLIKDSLSSLSATFADKGTYVCTEGPRLETPAEIRKFSIIGGDLVGMTLSPEVFLAKELEMCYATICYITNYAEGVVERPFKPGELFEGLANDDDRRLVHDAVMNFPAILKKIVGDCRSVKDVCVCRSLMERHRKRGDVGDDWHDWVSLD